VKPEETLVEARSGCRWKGKAVEDVGGRKCGNAAFKYCGSGLKFGKFRCDSKVLSAKIILPGFREPGSPCNFDVSLPKFT
jgi:hypothetical protein